MLAPVLRLSLRGPTLARLRISHPAAFLPTTSGTVRFAQPFLPHTRSFSSAMPLRACLAVSPDGSTAPDPTQTAPVLEQSPVAHGRLRTLVLNRPAALNALSQEMLDAIRARLRLHRAAPGVDAVLLTSAPGRAFCAGGDVRALYDTGCDKAGLTGGGRDAALAAARYFRAEYSLNWELASARELTVVALLDGIVMGGGVGVSVHGRFRVATENTLFAMPECAIGLHPDCGVSYLLARMAPGLGEYIALAGGRLSGADTVAAGIATHFVPAHMLSDLVERLDAVVTSSPTAIEKAIKEFAARDVPENVENYELIRECFASPEDGSADDLTVESVLERLQNVQKRGTEAAEFAEKNAKMITSACPTSLKVSLETLRRARKAASVKECLQQDFRLVLRSTARTNFYAGVKSALITRDRNPQWNPSKLSEVTQADVEALFEPLEKDLGIDELALSEETCLTGNNEATSAPGKARM